MLWVGTAWCFLFFEHEMQPSELVGSVLCQVCFPDHFFSRMYVIGGYSHVSKTNVGT